MKLVFCLQIYTKVFCKFIVSLEVCLVRHAQSTHNNKFAISLQYLKKNIEFLLAVKHRMFLQIYAIILGVWPCMPKLKFPISLQYIKKGVMKLNFLHIDNHESFLQIDTMIFDGCVKHSESSQNSKFVMSLQYLKKEIRDKWVFCMQINIKVSFKLISTLWASKFPTR